MRYDAAKTTEPAGRALIIAGPADYNGALDAVIANLRRYLGPPPGLYYENPGADDRFVTQAALATSRYHIVGAIAGLCRKFRRLPQTSTKP